MIHRVDSQQYPNVAEILASAFYNDPVFNWFMRQDSEKEKALKDIFTTVSNEFYSESIVYKDNESRTGSIWIDSKDMPSSSELAEPMKTYLIECVTRWCSEKKVERFLYLNTLQEEAHPSEPHHYLWVVGVRPEVQGQGYGTRMLRHHLDVLDQLGVPAYLENSNEVNAPLYRRLGFNQINEIKVDEKGPYLWGMWREPK